MKRVNWLEQFDKYDALRDRVAQLSRQYGQMNTDSERMAVNAQLEQAYTQSRTIRFHILKALTASEKGE